MKKYLLFVLCIFCTSILSASFEVLDYSPIVKKHSKKYQLKKYQLEKYQLEKYQLKNKIRLEKRFKLNSDQPSKILYQEYETNDEKWVDYLREEYEYDDNDNNTKVTISLMIDDREWKEIAIEKWKYNKDDNVTEDLLELWYDDYEWMDTSGVTQKEEIDDWVEDSKYKLTYKSGLIETLIYKLNMYFMGFIINNKIIWGPEMGFEKGLLDYEKMENEIEDGKVKSQTTVTKYYSPDNLDPEWTNYQKAVLTYKDDLVDEVAIAIWYEVGGEFKWLKVQEDEYEYNDKDFQTKKTSSVLFTIGDPLELYANKEWTYTDFDYIESELEQWYKDDKWVDTLLTENKFNDDENLTKQTKKHSPDGDEWVNIVRVKVEYKDGLRKSETFQLYENDDWIDAERALFYYGNDAIDEDTKNFQHKMIRNFYIVSNGINQNIRFSVMNSVNATLNIYNLKGKLIATPIKHLRLDKGIQSVVWDMEDSNGASVASGTYLYELHINNILLRKHINIIK